jgi:hypothetical protein
VVAACGGRAAGNGQSRKLKHALPSDSESAFCTDGEIWWMAIWTILIWTIERSQQGDVAEGALIHELKAGLLAMHQRHGGRGSKSFGSVGQAGEVVTGGLGSDLDFERVGFDGHGAVHTPVSGAHFFDHAEFHAVVGLETVDVHLHEELEVFFGFGFEKQGSGE